MIDCRRVERLPESSGMGSYAGGSFSVSKAAPGQIKPLVGQGIGTLLPVGLQNPGGTSRQPRSDAKREALEYVPPLQLPRVSIAYKRAERDVYTRAPGVVSSPTSAHSCGVVEPAVQ